MGVWFFALFSLIFIVIEKKFAAIPFNRLFLPAKSKVSAILQENLTDPVSPLTKEKIRAWYSCNRSINNKIPRIIAAKDWTSRDNINKCFRLYLSAKTPATGLNNVIPTPATPADIPTHKGEFVISRTNHPRANGSIARAASLNRSPNQNFLNRWFDRRRNN